MRDHVYSYLTLLVGLGVTFLLLLLAKGSVQYQMLIGLAGCAFYSVWGILHHHFEGRSNIKVIIEYILISTLAFLLLLFAISF